MDRSKLMMTRQKILSWTNSIRTALRIKLAGRRVQARSISRLSETPKMILFERSETPEVSIIIPVYEKLNYTLRCLASIALNLPKVDIEVIVVDDASQDGSLAILSEVKGIHLVSNQQNVGFIGSCRLGADMATGRYLHFLNNDTEVTSRWLDELLNTVRSTPNVGLVGSKLIYPDGHLQEAGGIVWQDGSAWNWGHREDPTHCAYNYVRDADYISGASILIAADTFRRLGMFKETYSPAYYEDTDLAMAVRHAGQRVVYQPFSEVIHHEGISSGSDPTKGAKRYQEINRIKFREAWEQELRYLSPRGHRPFLSCDRTRLRHILVVDACTPTPDQDSGSIDMLNLIKILIDEGWRVHFVPLANFKHLGGYTEHLQRLGVECVYGPHYRTLKSYLQERGDMFEICLLARTDVTKRSLPDVEKFCPSAKKIFYTVDLHFLREKREAELLKDATLLRRARQTECAELELMDRVDSTVVLSEVEREILDGRGKVNLSVIPLIREVGTPIVTRVERRSGVLFVGGFQHQPNVDAVDWLITDVWSEVRAILKRRGLPEIPLYIAGSKMPRRFLHLDATDIHPIGFVPDIKNAFERVRLSVAPLRYGAGLKGKVASSFLYGIPVVGTAMAFEGMPRTGLEDVRLQADTARELAQLVVDLHFDDKRLTSIGGSCRSYAIQHYSKEAIALKVRELLQSLTGSSL